MKEISTMFLTRAEQLWGARCRAQELLLVPQGPKRNPGGADVLVTHADVLELLQQEYLSAPD